MATRREVKLIVTDPATGESAVIWRERLTPWQQIGRTLCPDVCVKIFGLLWLGAALGKAAGL